MRAGLDVRFDAELRQYVAKARRDGTFDVLVRDFAVQQDMFDNMDY